MASYINNDEIQRQVLKVLKDDMNECLEATTNKVVADMKEKVRANVAARMIALIQSDYNMRYMQGELRIFVKIGENHDASL